MQETGAFFGANRMCRNIKHLRRDDPPVTRGEFEEAALNLVRKLSGHRAPAAPNRAAFDKAVAEITAYSIALLANLQVKGGVKPCVEI